ncbi:LAME_0E07514g1_1 [Lachancea meyersii CBS 8951]|uniref:E3 ubiquitin protein ligase n=1 Tax=Lachancea meyersii CBS 8951 TaxID=1266667 RepID=A0A1G4JIK2_9SACH|nr:LAME_0E07514g1_1 [Lachancea meyersii CBS 8951]
MSEEPAGKKARLDWGLSDPTEPLTRKDVIAFQKEALFRALNKHRTRAASLETQLGKDHENLAQLRDQYARVCATLAVLAAKLSDLCKDDSEAQKVCDSIVQGAETNVSKVADQLAVLFDKYAGHATEDSNLTSHFHALEKSKVALSTHNQQLQQELEAVRDHYQTLIRLYDREDSETVKRVQKIKESRSESDEAKALSEATEAAVNSANATQDNVKTGASGNTHDEKVDFISHTEHDLQVQELSNQVEALRNTINDLESWKTKREDEIMKLRTELANSTGNNQEQYPDGQLDRDYLMRRLETLTEENTSLTHANESFLTKFQKLVQDKEVFTNKLTSEFQTAQDALKKHNAMLEKDLVRIRNTRDEMTGKMAILESQRLKSELLDDLQTAMNLQKDRIDKMESKEVEISKDALTKELQDLECAYKELSRLAHKKYTDQLAQESLLTKLNIEKTKADQKYFAAMRSKDSILIENKNLTKNLAKSNELITQLKEIERTLQEKIESLIKQIHLHESNEKRLVDANKNTSSKLMDVTSALSKSKKTIESLSHERVGSVEKISDLELQVHSAQTEVNALKLKLSHAESKAAKLHEALTSSTAGDTSVIAEELENFRTIVYCSLCSKNWKNTAIKTCGHVFCDQCCKERLAARMRKCPICRMQFGSHDLLDLHM